MESFDRELGANLGRAGGTMPVVHLTAKLRSHVTERLEHAHARWLWCRLRPAFPNALAVLLMPDHPHLVADVADVARAHLTFTKILGAFSRDLPVDRPVWKPVPPPKILVGPHKILREIRYVALNPARRHLVKDPLDWYWSTYRDLVGAVADAWVTLDRVGRAVPLSFRGDLTRVHHSVSADRDTDIRGTPMPSVAMDTAVPLRPLGDILVAAAAATRAPIEGVRRRGPTRAVFVHLAAAQGWNDVARLANICGTSTRAISDLLHRAPPQGLDAARLCLGDHRLLRAPGAPTLASDADRLALGSVRFK